MVHNQFSVILTCHVKILTGETKSNLNQIKTNHNWIELHKVQMTASRSIPELNEEDGIKVTMSGWSYGTS